MFVSIALLGSTEVSALQNGAAALFGYTEYEKTGLSLFPQWIKLLERHLKDLPITGKVTGRDELCQDSDVLNSCSMYEWLQFLESIRNKLPEEQIRLVNQFANEKAYVLDMDNYGIQDYWATPKEFLSNDGDCEDYAIIKMLSMKWLGFDTSRMRVVVVQDTNLRIAHAVMAITYKDEVYILDNQIPEVLPHSAIFHYVPVYSINEKQWWMHVPG